MPYYYAFLRVALNIYHSVDVYIILRFFESFHSHLNRIWYLLIIIKQYLFAYYLTYKKSCRLVGKLILIKVRRRIGQQFFYSF